MKLNPTDAVWCPADNPEYLCLLPQGANPPQNPDSLLSLQVDLLRQLLAQASPREVQGQQAHLQEQLPEEFLYQLPGDLLLDQRFPDYLLRNPAPEGSRLFEWKEGLPRA